MDNGSDTGQRIGVGVKLADGAETMVRRLLRVDVAVGLTGGGVLGANRLMVNGRGRASSWSSGEDSGWSSGKAGYSTGGSYCLGSG